MLVGSMDAEMQQIFQCQGLIGSTVDCHNLGALPEVVRVIVGRVLFGHMSVEFH
jgi:hypothetical protein